LSRKRSSIRSSWLLKWMRIDAKSSWLRILVSTKRLQPSS